MRRIQKLKAGDLSVYPFNHAFTDQEKKVFQLIEKLKATMGELKTELANTPMHAFSEVLDIDSSLDALDLNLRWMPGGYRYE